MSRELKEGKVEEKGSSNVVVVAVKASKEMPKTALIWALTHLLNHPHDCTSTITLLVVLPSQTSGRRLSLWGFPRFSGDCATNTTSVGHINTETSSDLKDSFAKMIMLQLHNNHFHKMNVNIKIVSGGGVAAEAKKAFANWVIFDKHLKHEKKQCMEELQCNIVVMKRSQPKVLRLNLASSTPTKEQAKVILLPDKPPRKEKQVADSILTPISSPETFTATSSFSSSDPGTSPFFIEKKVQASGTKEIQHLENSSSETESDNNFSESSLKSNSRKTSINYSRNVREAISLSRNARSSPPPLCSICKHKGPIFGKPPRWFTYNELELATGGFSRANFLAEGGFGSVHRGVLLDGQAVAVKQHKLANSQGDREFCSEVEVLSCAQHRNVVMLIGFCVEEGRRLLVYEYICNGSLDSHLYDGHHRDPLEWSARQKIAVGAARGLRYLHEDCRVGCIVHRDLRPNNILLTHDFEPMVGDFGLSRWQPDGDVGVETRVIGTFGYLAPEYTQSGQITEKADVYSFGVVLVELVTGRKAVDLNRPKGQQCLIEWARPLLDEDNIINKLIDSRLGSDFDEHEVYYMLHAASLCLRWDPQSRPRMSQVLRILEGDHGFSDLGRLLSPGLDGGNRTLGEFG